MSVHNPYLLLLGQGWVSPLVNIEPQTPCNRCIKPRQFGLHSYTFTALCPPWIKASALLKYVEILKLLLQCVFFTKTPTVSGPTLLAGPGSNVGTVGLPGIVSRVQIDG